MERLKVIQIGVGGFGHYRRERMRETGLFELVAAYDWNEEALARCQVEDGAKLARSYEELLETPGVEAVVISTGANFHAEQAIQAIAKGLHVFIEKPLCATRDELRCLLEAQKKYGVVVGVGHKTPDPASQTIKKMIEHGELGAVTTFEKTTAHSGGLQIKPGDWRGDPEKNPGGMLFQCGVHGLHELMYYFGPITQVFCMMRFDVHETQTADVAICHLKFESGLIGTLNAYHVTPYRHSLSIFGTKANLYRNDRYFDEETQLQIQHGNLTNSKELISPVTISGEDDGCSSLRSFYKAIREGTEPYPSIRDGARAVAVVFAADESSRTGLPVSLCPT